MLLWVVPIGIVMGFLPTMLFGVLFCLIVLTWMPALVDLWCGALERAGHEPYLLLTMATLCGTLGLFLQLMRF